MNVGFVALVGRPNSGKSSFLNALIGEKIGIVSQTPQTTRRSIKGIYTDKQSQIIFFDTPGIHESKEEFNVSINAVAKRAIEGADALLHFIDSARPYGEEERMIEELVSESKKPVIQVYSRSDISLPIERRAGSIAVSSVTKEGLWEVIQRLIPLLPEWEPYYDEDYCTDQDPYTRVSEIIREKAFLLLSEEIPHSLYVSVEEFEEKENLLKILAYIVVDRESQKRIVIGKNGAMIQKIGTLARKELEDIFGRKIFLSVRVKDDPGWKRNKKIIKGILS